MQTRQRAEGVECKIDQNEQNTKLGKAKYQMKSKIHQPCKNASEGRVMT